MVTATAESEIGNVRGRETGSEAETATGSMTATETVTKRETERGNVNVGAGHLFSPCLHLCFQLHLLIPT